MNVPPLGNRQTGKPTGHLDSVSAREPAPLLGLPGVLSFLCFPPFTSFLFSRGGRKP